MMTQRHGNAGTWVSKITADDIQPQRDEDLSVEIVSYGEGFEPYKSHFARELSDEEDASNRIVFTAHTRTFSDHTHPDRIREIVVPAMSCHGMKERNLRLRLVIVSHCKLAGRSHYGLRTASVHKLSERIMLKVALSKFKNTYVEDDEPVDIKPSRTRIKRLASVEIITNVKECIKVLELDIPVNADAGNFLVSPEDLSPNGFQTV